MSVGHFTVHFGNSSEYLRKKSFENAKAGQMLLVKMGVPGTKAMSEISIRVTKDAYELKVEGGKPVYAIEAEAGPGGEVTGSVLLIYNTRYASTATLRPVVKE